MNCFISDATITFLHFIFDIVKKYRQFDVEGAREIWIYLPHSLGQQVAGLGISVRSVQWTPRVLQEWMLQKGLTNTSDISPCKSAHEKDVELYSKETGLQSNLIII